MQSTGKVQDTLNTLYYTIYNTKEVFKEISVVFVKVTRQPCKKRKHSSLKVTSDHINVFSFPCIFIFFLIFGNINFNIRKIHPGKYIYIVYLLDQITSSFSYIPSIVKKITSICFCRYMYFMFDTSSACMYFLYQHEKIDLYKIKKYVSQKEKM